MTIMPIFYNCTVTTGPQDKPPSGELLSQAMHKLKIRAAWCPPTVIEQLLEQPGGFEQAASLDWIMYTGGPLAQAAGDKLSKVTDVCQMYGSTETGPHISLVPLPENWAWFEWHPLLENVMDPVGDGTFEMVVYKDPSLEWVRHLSQAYPHLDVWRTNDLFVQKPDNPKLWRFAGRRDDVLVLSNGEKFNPVNMEGAIVGHSLVRGALIVGTGRFQASLIVEPRPDVALSKDEIIQEIWPTIQHANTLGPAHGRIFRHKICIATTDKPFKRAGKGTVIRGLTTKLYADEVAALYVEAETSEDQLLSISSEEEVTECIRSCISRMVSESISNTDDVFVMGLDSLQTLELVKSLNRVFNVHLQRLGYGPISTSMVYSHPTITQLGQHLHQVLNGLSPMHGFNTGDRTTAMNQLIERYSSNLRPMDTRSRSVTSSSQICVAITGSTGSLGQHLLQSLLQDNNVSKIYCLNRSEDAYSRTIDCFQARGLDTKIVEKAVFLKTDFNDQKLGLSSAEYDTMLNNLDIVIHNAWKVNFNHELSSFEDTHVRGVRHLIDFALASKRNTQIFFVSSLSSVGNWPAVHGAENEVPEVAMTDSQVAMQMGYGESKHVAERILQNATYHAGIKATILRVGQLAGPLAEGGGVWNRTEWFPNLVKTSKALGVLPNAMNTIDWIPVDEMAKVISELVIDGCTSDYGLQVFNLANPTVAEWTDLAAAIQDAWGADSIKVVPFKEWLDTLASKDDVERYPAIKILDFYQGLAQEAKGALESRIKYQVRRASSQSTTMASLAPVNKKAMATWLKQWSF